MTDQSPTPATVLSLTDPGDDMQMRVRYQSAYGAFIAVSLLDEDSGNQEIYCEQHEDILIRRANGKFHGCQVKTRLPRLGPFKADEEPIKTAISRFVAIDNDFPAQFERFIIASNVAFWQSEENAKNLPYIISLGQKMKSSSPSISRPIRGFVAGLSEKHSCDRKFVWNVLSKTHLMGELPQFSDIERELASEIGFALRQTSRRLDELNKAARALVQLVSNASSLNGGGKSFYYLVFAEHPEAAKIANIISGKRLSKELIAETIALSFQNSILLTSGNHLTSLDLPLGVTRLEKKMTAGGISNDEIALVKSLKNSVEVLLQEWYYKYGVDRALQQYDHLELAVKSDCNEAAQEASSKTQPLYGTKMLSSVRSNLKFTATNQASHLSDIGVFHQHLLGVAGMLTQQCKVWWSDEFDLGETDDAAQ